ncbi:hypothetical protein Tcan_15291 [Toxocara canis]|uniref:Uncharacterized protein n=1 Tax=Toxocara canis TaxID=6265 RepID=A0A0B2VLQ1_TOXCA|nr:hypothetical protein Tcan_15291 [Toxocara canis]
MNQKSGFRHGKTGALEEQHRRNMSLPKFTRREVPMRLIDFVAILCHFLCWPQTTTSRRMNSAERDIPRPPRYPPTPSFMCNWSVMSKRPSTTLYVEFRQIRFPMFRWLIVRTPMNACFTDFLMHFHTLFKQSFFQMQHGAGLFFSFL